jgi:hypothetical protein
MNLYDMNKHLPKHGKGTPPLKEVPPGTPIQVDLNNATIQVCPCGSKYFIPAISVYKVSALISPTGQELIANQQVVICAKCHLALGEKIENIVD